MKVLITGADGFVGSNLTKKLLEEHEVTMLDYIELPPKNLPEKKAYINMDLSSSDLNRV